MANFKNDIIKTITSYGESENDIQFVLVNGLIYEGWGAERDQRNIGLIEGGLYLWKDIAPKLDYEYDSGYGGMDCQDVEIWTPNFVYYIHEYVGSTSIQRVNRNPVGDMRL